MRFFQILFVTFFLVSVTQAIKCFTYISQGELLDGNLTSVDCDNENMCHMICKQNICSRNCGDCATAIKIGKFMKDDCKECNTDECNGSMANTVLNIGFIIAVAVGIRINSW